jgi:hypothetical protein
VAGFPAAQGHPDLTPFRNPPARDPGALRFDHALHRAPGLTLEPGGKPLMAGAPLRCESCHRPDAGGALMEPVRYERDCRTCHPLDPAPGLPPVRHGDQPAGVHESLWATFAARYVEARPGLTAWTPPPRPVPGRAERPEEVAASKAIGDEVAKAERVLFGGKRCGQCHAFETQDGRPVPAPAAFDPAKPFRVAGPGVPGRWLQHAAFDHSRHRALDCLVCHTAAASSRTSLDVLLPNADTCRRCHAPRQRSAGSLTGGAGFGCAECHSYHAPAAPGAGAHADLTRFLLGAPRS